jgi:epidermal growth factor receptor substrate 15
MIPPSKRKSPHVPPVPLNLVGVGAEGRSSPALGSPAIPGVSAAGSTSSWVVTPAEQTKYDDMFVAADLDKDGFVNGMEIKEIFIQSGVPQSVLAHIWYVVAFMLLVVFELVLLPGICVTPKDWAS